jgi:hypothetical protein
MELDQESQVLLMTGLKIHEFFRRNEKESFVS